MPIRPTSGTETRDQDGSEPKCATNVSLNSRLFAEARARRWLDENLAALQSEVDPIDGTTGTGFLVGSSAVPIC
jgi:hypothetical protein